MLYVAQYIVRDYDSKFTGLEDGGICILVDCVALRMSEVVCESCVVPARYGLVGEAWEGAWAECKMQMTQC